MKFKTSVYTLFIREYKFTENINPYLSGGDFTLCWFPPNNSEREKSLTL